jgi:flagellar hook-associated protein 1 FlgK
MQNYAIGLSGLTAAQKALDIIANNVANAATDGYHRQRVELTPAYMSQEGSILIGGGVEIAGVTRLIDGLLETELLRQQSALEQVRSELTTLRTVENTFGELSTGIGLSESIDQFFNALQDLTAHPTELIWQSQVVMAADTMAGQFRSLAEFLSGAETQITLEAENAVDRINTLINQIAELNDNIEKMEIAGKLSNNLQDQRDQRITELSELIGVETYQREYGVVDVSIAGIPVVTGASPLELDVSFNDAGQLGISVAGAYTYNTDFEGGRLGGLIWLKNEALADIHSDLDALAAALISRINQYHVQGVGSQGSFTQLSGWIMPNENLADFDPPVSNGKIYIRLVDTTTDTVTRHEIDIDASTDSLTTIAAAIDAIDGLSASVNTSRLVISADAGYEFDFLPAVLPEPTAQTLTGAAPPTISVSGIYTGTQNDAFKFTVSGAGSVGNGTLQLEVRDNGGAGSVIATLNIGQGYAAGDILQVGNGIEISVGPGDFGAGDNFDLDAFADTDSSGVLAAVGLNTFFSGTDAATIAVCSDVAESPGRVAAALGAEMTDNANVTRLVAVKDQSFSSLDALTPVEFYRRLVTEIGQELAIKQMRQGNIEVTIQNLTNQRDTISGVNINDEAAQMLVFEQMFQAMAKYMNAVHSSLSSLMEIV